MISIFAAALTAQPASAALQLVTEGCQFEGCRSSGEWIAKRDVPVYAALRSRHRIGVVRIGQHVHVLGTWIVTTKVGVAVLKSELHYSPQPPSRAELHLKPGTRLRVLFYEGEGYLRMMTPAGQRIDLDEESARTITPFHAIDWVKLRLPNGRIGWSNELQSFDCNDALAANDRCPTPAP
jgi:hypothetical protein